MVNAIVGVIHRDYMIAIFSITRALLGVLALCLAFMALDGISMMSVSQMQRTGIIKASTSIVALPGLFFVWRFVTSKKMRFIQKRKDER